MEISACGMRRLCAAALLLCSGFAFAGDPTVRFGPLLYANQNINSCVHNNTSFSVNDALSALNTGLAQDGMVYFQVDPPVIDADFEQDFTAPDGNTFHVKYDATAHAVNWSSSVGVDAAAVKGGHGANIYVYDPETVPETETDATHDSGLVTPVVCGNDDNIQCGLSHIAFCYDYRLRVNKTANTAFDRKYQWSINKSVSPQSLNLFYGDAGDVNYTVNVIKSAPIYFNEVISGTVTITNPAPAAYVATVTSVNDTLAGVGPVALTCNNANGPISLPYNMAPNETLTCPYSVPVSDTSSRVNTVTVATSGQVEGGTAAAMATFDLGSPNNSYFDSVNVSDTNGQSWSFGNSDSKTYPMTFNCRNQPGYNNTATITTDGAAQNPSSGAHVDIACYNLGVSKDAHTSYTRTWTWSINKSYLTPAFTADTNNDNVNDALLLTTGQSINLQYNVTVGAQSTDSSFQVGGTITVNNNNPARSATLTGLIDTVSAGLGMGVSCPLMSVPPSGSVTCTYSGLLPDSSSRTNTATATQQNYHYAADGTPSPTSTTSYSNTVPVAVAFDLANPNSLVDNCVTVSDAFNNALSPATLATLCAGPGAGAYSRTLSYANSFTWNAALGTCVTLAVPNTANFATNTTGTQGASATAVINITNRDCAQGCTLTQGYWKSHSSYGPAAHPDLLTWARVGGPDATFFYSGVSWYTAFWTSPSSGNAYWTLAHQYEAAVLNHDKGASEPPDVITAVNTAYLLFNNPANTPAAVGALKSNSATRQQFIQLAALLDMYNNGKYPGGPQHCTEDSSSSSTP